ncbi:MAG: hypothetical protein V4613_03720 [Bacteroidota bacterium]
MINSELSTRQYYGVFHVNHFILYYKNVIDEKPEQRIEVGD